METVNNATAAVKNAIWGEGANTESGSNTTSSGGHRSGGLTETHKSMIDDTVTESHSYSGKTESDPMAEGAYDPDKQKVETSPQGPSGGKPQGENVTGQQDTNDKSMSNSNEPNTGFGGSGAQPSVNADPNSAQQDTTKQQGADKPNEKPSTGSGESSGGPSGGPPGGGSSGGPGGMKLPDDGQSKGEGTGQKWEKSTGLNADGGDFDAARPGAAREAERLMDEKGIKHGAEAKDAPGEGDGKEKKWYGVDHSGFGGHGSHDNKKSSVSGQGGASKSDTTSKNDTDTDTTAHDHSTHSAHSTHTSAADDVDDGTGKKGLGQKIKEKLHHS